MKVPRLLVLAMLLVAAVAVAQDESEYVPQDATRCWECHAPGLWTPPMNPNVEVFPLLSTADVGQEFDYRAELVNVWRAEQLDMFMTLDIRDAPSLRFVGGQDPIQNETSGAITFEPSAPSPGSPQNTFLTRPAREGVGIHVPTGATALKLTLAPQDTDGTSGPDLTMRVYDARTEVGGNPTQTIDETGKGQSEVYRLDGASEVASHGFGEWTIEAEITRAQTSGLDPQFEDVDFTVTLDAWFNATEETQQVVTKPGPLAKGSKEIFTWKVQLVAPPGPGEEILVRANVTTHYEHEAASDPDYWNMTFSKTGPVTAVADTTASVGLETADIVVSAPTATGVSMAAISESIGYAATFLLAASIYTGGIFGKASRRGLNVIFGGARRRVAFHNFLSYGIITAATVHMTIFVIDAIEPNYPWQLGLIWGGLGILCMLGLGVTGALQVPMIRKWNYATWRWIHFGLSIGAILFTLVHMMLDGQNFSFIQDAIDYQDPLVPGDRQ